MRIALIFGGKSAERDVSIASGAEVLKALKHRGHEILVVDTARGILGPDEEEQLLSSRVMAIPPDTDELAMIQSGASELASWHALAEPDVLFLALHGGMGEDGTLQAFLDIAGLPYTGSGHMPSVYAMDKDVSKQLFRAADIPTPDWIMAPCSPDEVEQQLDFPAIVKPNKQGSTIGLTLVDDEGGLEAAINEAYRYDDEVMIESFVPGRELTVGILEDRALAVGEIIPRRARIFDYQNKYQEGGAEEIFPADLSPQQTRTVRQFGLAAHRALKLQDYSRIDFRMDPRGAPWCLEANSLPGLTARSLLPQSAAEVGISFPELCERICQLAITRHHTKGRQKSVGAEQDAVPDVATTRDAVQ